MHFLGQTGSKTTQVYLNLDLQRTLHMLKLFSGKKTGRNQFANTQSREDFFKHIWFLVWLLLLVAHNISKLWFSHWLISCFRATFRQICSSPQSKSLHDLCEMFFKCTTAESFAFCRCSARSQKKKLKYHLRDITAIIMSHLKNTACL